MAIEVNCGAKNILEEFTINCTITPQVVISNGRSVRGKNKIEVRYVQVESQRPNYDLETMEKFN